MVLFLPTRPPAPQHTHTILPSHPTRTASLDRKSSSASWSLLPTADPLLLPVWGSAFKLPKDPLPKPQPGQCLNMAPRWCSEGGNSPLLPLTPILPASTTRPNEKQVIAEDTGRGFDLPTAQKPAEPRRSSVRFIAALRSTDIRLAVAHWPLQAFHFSLRFITFLAFLIPRYLCL